MVRKMAYVGFSYLAGLFFASFFAPPIAAAAAAALLAGASAAVCFIRKYRSRGHIDTGRLMPFTVCAYACAFGILLYCGYDLVIYRSIRAYDGETVSCTGTVIEAEPLSDGKYIYTLRGKLNGGITADFCVYAEPYGIVKGDRMTVSGRMYIPRGKTNFDAEAYYRSKNIFLFMSSPTVEDTFCTSFNIYRLTSSIRSSIVTRIRALLPCNEGELLIGMLFGKSFGRIDTGTEALLQRSGIGHITAVSGMHLAIAAGIFIPLFSLLFPSPKARFAAAGAIAIFFGVMTDFSPSIIRSGIMLLLIYMGGILGRRSDSLNSLGISVIAVTLFTPFAVRDSGFLLSLAGSMGTSVLAPALYRIITEKADQPGNINSHRKSPLLYSAISSCSAAAAVFPAALLSFNEISVAAPITNLLLSPLYSAALALAVIGSLLYPVGFLSKGLFLSAGIISKPVIYFGTLLGSPRLAAIPLGLDVVRPTAAICGIFILAAVLITRDSKYSVLAFSFAAAVFAVVVSVCRIIPDNGLTIAILTDSKGCCAVFTDGNSACVIDMTPEKSSPRTAADYLSSHGIRKTDMVLLTEKAGSKAGLYNDLLPSPAEYISPTEGTGSLLSCNDELTYTSSNCTMNITYSGNDILVVCGQNGESVSLLFAGNNTNSPRWAEQSDMIIYNGSGSEAYLSDNKVIAVTNEGFGGSFPAGTEISYCCSAEYRISGGKLIMKG
ncbi:MAG: ComEC/Rec2 family competence protein [Huintestinicola sp.]